MRLPFLQVSQEEMARARTLAGYLGVPYAHALGMTVAIKAAALESATDDDVSGAIHDPNPAEWLAVQCGWPMGRADVLAAALARCGFAMAGPSGGHVVAGMEPYRKALGTSEKRAEAGRKGAEARKSMGGYGKPMAGPWQGDGHSMARDAKTQTQTQTQTEATASQGAAFAGQQGPGWASDADVQEATPGAPGTSNSEAVGQPRPALVLEPLGAARVVRRPSKAEALYLRIQEAREKACAAAGMPFVPDRWDNARQNKALGPVVKADPEEQRRFEAAFQEYMGDDAVGEKGWPLSLFISGAVRSRYEQQALRAAGSAS